jgi:protein translocase subunit secA
LLGERIGIDVLNTIYDTSTAIVDQHEGDFESFKLELFKVFAMECPFTEDEFRSGKSDALSDKLFGAALKNIQTQDGAVVGSSQSGNQASLRKSGRNV